jgi:hypothetical protein
MMRKGPLKGWHSFKVDVRGDDIIVGLASANFQAGPRPIGSPLSV